MSRFGRVGRRPDHWDSPHERARLRLAERMAGDLPPDEASWLDEHLAGCADCTSVGAQYAADQADLRALRDAPPEPPRDLWARTAAAIEQESGGRRNPERATRRASRIPLGALSGIAVIALVVGVSALSGVIGPGGRPTATTEEASDQLSTTGGDAGSGPDGAQATPFAVGAGDVRWIDKSTNGTLAYNHAAVGEVCPAEGTASCPALQDTNKQRLAVNAAPRTIIESTKGAAVMVADDGSGHDKIMVVHLPQATATPTPSPVAGAVASPPASATASVGAQLSPIATTPPPSQTPEPSQSVEASAVATPIGDAGSPTPSVTPSPTPSVTPPLPSLSPSPSIASTIAIASDIELVGESAAFSADGTWFAFTARPADRSRGTDVYIWHVGDASAHALTTDGATVFASWDGGHVVASRPIASASAEAATPSTIRIDPATGEESPAGDVWRPVVDPTRTRAIGWTGTLMRSADGTTWTPDVGELELRPWSADGATSPADGQRDGKVVTDAAAAGFDVRWDEAGDWVAIWVADAVDPTVGRLSLYRVDVTRSRLVLMKDAPAGVAALPGFSIGQGRLAWATPPGQDGEGSRIQIVAWNEDGIGTIETAPGEDLVVVR